MPESRPRESGMNRFMTSAPGERSARDPQRKLRCGFLLFALLLCCWVTLQAGVSRELQNLYVQNYENRAMYLKVPIHGAGQSVFVRPGGPVLDSSTIGLPAVFRVGDQVRIDKVDFRNDRVRFRLISVDGNQQAELNFLFPTELINSFPQQPQFDQALDYALTQGRSYRDIEAARENFVDNQFDQMLERFAATAGVSSEQLVQRITEGSPDYQKLRSDLATRTEQANQRQQALDREQAEAQRLAGENSRLTREIQQSEAAADSLKEERLELLDERDALRRQLSELESAQADWQRKTSRYEQQVDNLIRNLDVTSDSQLELDNKVASLSTVIDELKTEGSALSGKLEESGRRVNDLLQQNDELEQDNRRLRNENAKLDSNLRVLTTGSNNINQTLLEVQASRDSLMAAQELAYALGWNQGNTEGEGKQASISLGAHKIGEFDMEEPSTTDESYSFRFRLESPDLVKFDEKERALYEQLGETVRVETHWRTPEGLEARLERGEPIQQIEARGEAEWAWSFAGSLEEPVPVVLGVLIQDANGHEIQLAEREFILRSSGFFSSLTRSFSFWSLLLGVAIGLAFTLLRRSSKPAQRPPHPVDYMAKKGL